MVFPVTRPGVTMRTFTAIYHVCSSLTDSFSLGSQLTFEGSSLSLCLVCAMGFLSWAVEFTQNLFIHDFQLLPLLSMTLQCHGMNESRTCHVQPFSRADQECVPEL